MGDRFVIHVVRAHRSILIGSTILLAIAGSRVASDVWLLGSWLLILGSANLMYVSDMCSEVDSDARNLARVSHTDLSKTRVDCFRASVPNSAHFGLWILGSAIALCGGFAIEMFV